MSVAWISELPSFVLAGNERIGPLVIDVKTGRFIGIWNSLNQVEYGLENWLFEVQLEGATLRSDQAQKVTAEAGPGLIRLKHDYADCEVEVIARETSVKGFAEYLLQVRRKDGGSFYVQRVLAGDFHFRDKFEQAILHTDGSIFRTPINAFLRSHQGGAILGLTYPYQEIVLSESGNAASLSYEVETLVPAAQHFETQPLFVGTYAFTGMGIFKPLDQVA